MITIVIATYNRRHTLGRAIESVFAQDFEEWELVVVDDGSTDDSAGLVEQYNDSRVKLVRHAINRGVTAAKNTGLNHIRGEWFTTMDSDDEMMPEAFSAMVTAAERTGATAITCNAIDSVKGTLTGSGVEADGWLDTARAAAVKGIHWGITRTELLGNLRFDERMPWGEEILWAKIGRKARRYYVQRPLLIVHTEGSDRLTIEKRSLAARLHDFRVLAEDREYLDILRETDPKMYRQRMNRIAVAKMLSWLPKSSR